MRGNTGRNRFEMNAFCMRFETLCGDKSKKNLQKIAFLSAIFTFANASKTRAKTLLKLKYFLHALWDTLRRKLKKKNLKPTSFSNFHFCMQSIGKNHIEMDAISMRFEILCGDQFEKTCKKTTFLWVIFTLVNACKTRT